MAVCSDYDVLKIVAYNLVSRFGARFSDWSWFILNYTNPEI